MPFRNIENIRFQQLRLFKAIYEFGNISTAAKMQGITQSSASKQLQQLRQHFEDDLFVRSSTGMTPTAKAASLLSNVQNILNEIQVMEDETDFSPQDLNSQFIISTTDEIQHLLLQPLIQRLTVEAPKVRVQFKPLSEDYSGHELESGNVSTVISVNWSAPEHLVQSPLFQDHFTCLMRQHHPLLKEKLNLENYAYAEHMMVAPLGLSKGFIDEILDNYSLERDVKLMVPNFMQIGPILEQSNMIVTLPKNVANTLCQTHQLAQLPLPFEVPPFRYYQFWHQRYKNDKARIWFFNLVKSILHNWA